MKNIAFLGIGAMSQRIATNLINAEYQLHIWNRTPQKCQSLIEKGAIAYNSPYEAVRLADVAIAMITDNRASAEVWLNKTTGAIHALKPDTIVIESSTLTPTWCRELGKQISKHNCNFLDAPVVGSRPQAKSKQLTYLVGGQRNIVRRVKEIVTYSYADSTNTDVGFSPIPAIASDTR